MSAQPQTAEQLRAQGFPTAVTDAFLRTANQLDAVVMSRAPGAATEQLIAEGQDLKGFFIKAKSCNWGPMAGFVCQLPAFNKNGADGIRFNYGENLDYVNGNPAHNHTEGYFYTQNPTDNGSSADPKRSPWVPLVISDARQQALFAGGYLDTNLSVDNAGDPETIVGLAYDSGKTVAVQYLMIKNDGPPVTWSVYHGNVYYKSQSTWQSFLDYLYLATPDTAPVAPDPQLMPIGTPAVGMAIPGTYSVRTGQWFKTVFDGAVMPADMAKAWYPINGIQNPSPVTYAGQNPAVPVESPSNAIVGDYDLFGVWPKLADESILPELVRYTETSINVAPPVPETLFEPQSSKPLTVRSAITTNILVECVPDDSELAQHLSLGNISSLIAHAAGALNSFFAYLPMLNGASPPQGTWSWRNVKETPNRAFHSDDGGRPGIWNVEMPVAVFLPAALGAKVGFTAADRILLLQSTLDFWDLIDRCRAFCCVPLNAGWVAYTFALFGDDTTLAGLAGAAEQTYADDFKKVVKERQTLIAAGVDGLPALAEFVGGLLTTTPSQDNNPAFTSLIADSIEFCKGTVGKFPRSGARVKQLLSYRTPATAPSSE